MPAKASLRLDGADPINRALMGFWPSNETPYVVRDIGPYRMIGRPTSTVPTMGVTPFGRSITYVPGRPVSSANNAPNTARYSFFAVIKPGFSSTSGGSLNMLERANSGDRIQLLWLGGGDGWYMDDVGAGSSGWGYRTGGTQPAFTAGETHTIGFTYGGAANTGQWYWDGRPIATTAIGTSSNSGTGRAGFPFVLGNNWDGALQGVRFYSRALTVGEIARLHRDPWAGTARRTRWVAAQTSANFPLTVDPLAYQHTLAAVGITTARGMGVDALAYRHTLADVDLTYDQNTFILSPDALSYGHQLAAVGMVYTPARVDGDTHDGFKRRSRRQRALDAAERRRRDALAQEALALRLGLEAAMGEAADAAENAPEPVAERVEAATQAAARYLPRLAASAEPAVLQAAQEAIVALRTAIAAADRARMLAEDDEDVLVILRAL